MIARSVWRTEDGDYDLKIDHEMRKTMMDELVKKAMNALSRSFNNDEGSVYEALECLESWANLSKPMSFSTRKEEPVDEALERKEF